MANNRGGEIDYNLRLLQFDKDIIMSQIKSMHNDIIEILNDKSGTEQELLELINQEKNEFEKKYEYLKNNFPTIFNSLLTTTNYKLDILLDMIEKLFKIGIEKQGGKELSMEIADKLHKTFTNGASQ